MGEDLSNPGAIRVSIAGSGLKGHNQFVPPSSKQSPTFPIPADQLELLLNGLAQLRAQIEADPMDRSALSRLHESLDRWAWAIQLRSSSLLSERTAMMVVELNQRMTKQVEWKTAGFDFDLDHPTFDAVSNVLIHAVRNAFAHGIETSGTIEAWLSVQQGSLQLVIEDNGRGPDVSRIRARAVEKGLVQDSEAAGFSEEQWIEFLFAPGFSTQDSADELSGRGVGLDSVRARVEELGGSITASRAPSGGFRLSMRAPLRTLGAEVVLAKIGDHRFFFPRGSLQRIEGNLPDIDRKSLRTWCDFTGHQSEGLELYRLVDQNGLFPVSPRIIGLESLGAPSFRGFRRLDPIWKTTGPQWMRGWFASAPGLASSDPELGLWIDPGMASLVLGALG